jgi:hypothetical protein
MIIHFFYRYILIFHILYVILGITEEQEVRLGEERCIGEMEGKQYMHWL